MFIKEIYIYSTIEAWLSDTPDTILKGSINSRNATILEIQDESGLTQLINMEKLFAVVY